MVRLKLIMAGVSLQAWHVPSIKHNLNLNKVSSSHLNYKRPVHIRANMSSSLPICVSMLPADL